MRQRLKTENWRSEDSEFIAGDFIDEQARTRDEELLCNFCNGSGEGMHDGTTCSQCRGTGVY